ncbi:MAG TPA: NADH-quinone oxidoreductase subunit H, partial [Polyangiaceae bacterium]|nr:NADH-quinone oxidoreductase subunit H [Polyangiaceae bacterium]
ASASRAERASLVAGDQIVEFEGVRLRSLADLFPSSRARTVQLLVQRSGTQDPVSLALDVQGFRSASAEELAPAAALVALAASLFLLFALPALRLLTWCEQRLAARLAAARITRPVVSGRATARVLRGFYAGLRARVPEPRVPRSPVRLVPYLTCLLTTALFTLLSAGQALFMPELDLLLLLIVGATIVAITALVVGGAAGGSWSLLSGLKRAALVGSCQLPLFAAVASVLLVAGSLRVRDLVLVQGAWPWQWHAFKNPALCLTFVLFLVSLVPDLGKSTLPVSELAADRGPQAPKHPAAAALSYFAEWSRLLLAGGACAVLFLGGWQLPWIGPAEQQAYFGYQALGAALVLVKCWAVVLVVLALRWLLPALRLSQVMRFCWRWCIPLSAAGVGLSFVWSHVVEQSLLRALEAGSGRVLFGVTVFLAAYLARAVLRTAREPNALFSVNPWL